MYVWGILFVNEKRLLLLLIVMFISLTLMMSPRVPAQVSPPRLATDKPVYPYWNTGGKVVLNASQLNVNMTYYLWLHRPDSRATRVGSPFQGKNGTVLLEVNVGARDPAGTYALSLSTSGSSDTGEAVAHFGIFGTDKSAYTRTQVIVISGGGFAPNSTIALGVRGVNETGAAFQFNVESEANGAFSYRFRIPPSQALGTNVVTANGPSFDTGIRSSVSANASVGPSAVVIRLADSPPPTVERTAPTSVTYQITYPDNSPVTTATDNSRKVIVVRDPDETTVAEIPLILSDFARGIWRAVWIPSVAASLSSYHFEMSRAEFDDSYGNLGVGAEIVSEEFAVVRADLEIAFQVNSTLQRTQETNVTMAAKYHDGSNFANATQMAASITDPGASPVTLRINSTSRGFVAYLKIPVNGRLGPWRIAANLEDAYGNVASGTYLIQVQKAVLQFSVDTPASAERTTIMNVSARIAYPDGTTVTPSEIPSGFNVTITHGNFTWTHAMSFNGGTGRWSAGYAIPQNATLGDYGIAMRTEDEWANGGSFATTSVVVPATFSFDVPQRVVKAEAKTFVDIFVYVRYPNGSALIPSVGGQVVATHTNSSGTFGFPMVYNSTDGSWHMFFYAPDLGVSFGITLTFSFDAKDAFGNSGAVANAYEVDVGAGTQTLILATILGAVVPAALVGWAIVTISGRRRKHKP